jgi:predicted exporter
MLEALEAEGFQTAAFQPMVKALEGDSPPPLRLTDLADSPLGPAVRPFTMDVGQDVAVLTFLQGVEDPAAVAAAVESVEGAVYFDQRQFLARNYRAYRVRIQWLVALGLLGVGLILLVRYRRPGLALAAFAPALLAAVTTVAILALAGHELHLLHLVGVLLVLSMGVDYGVFLAESSRHGEGVDATLLGLVIACISTVLAFGLLGMSDNPAMEAAGFTTGLGVLISLVLAPTTLVLTGGSRDTEGS